MSVAISSFYWDALTSWGLAGLGGAAPHWAGRSYREERTHLLTWLSYATEPTQSSYLKHFLCGVLTPWATIGLPNHPVTRTMDQRFMSPTEFIYSNSNPNEMVFEGAFAR